MDHCAVSEVHVRTLVAEIRETQVVVEADVQLERLRIPDPEPQHWDREKI